MGKRKRGEQRPFNPRALQKFAVPELYPRVGWITGLSLHGCGAIRTTPTNKKAESHFAGSGRTGTASNPRFCRTCNAPFLSRLRLRDPGQPHDKPEMNYNAYYVVYAAPIRESDHYFRALQIELQEALAEGVILIERQEVYLV